LTLIARTTFETLSRRSILSFHHSNTP
jgi:hypothetical protein